MRVFKPTYTDRKGGTKKAVNWYVDLSDQRGLRRSIKGFTDKAATEACRVYTSDAVDYG